jgi:hypothetical protein
MSTPFSTGSEGEQRLAEFLRARGHVVSRSDTKTFDLIVDGRYAEVKSSRGPYSSLGFIGLTNAQRVAMMNGTEFTVFVVCNLAKPDSLEVHEFHSSQLLREEPKTEPVYYWYRSQLERCRGGG